MGINNQNPSELADNLLRVKIGTLLYHLPKEEVEKYYGCDFEFHAVGENHIPIDLHIWVGENHNYREKYHKVFSVPEQLRIPLLKP